MQIFFNGETREVPDGISVAELLRTLNLPAQRVAVEVNLEVVPRATHAQHPLRDGDRLEVVSLVGGG